MALVNFILVRRVCIFLCVGTYGIGYRGWRCPFFVCAKVLDILVDGNSAVIFGSAFAEAVLGFCNGFPTTGSAFVVTRSGLDSFAVVPGGA